MKKKRGSEAMLNLNFVPWYVGIYVEGDDD